ncbi:MAG: hypothetical protein J5736_05160, partial [Bacilli bacterium]|nr:hypothetical protein [Bacilli bacterium]
KSFRECLFARGLLLAFYDPPYEIKDQIEEENGRENQDGDNEEPLEIELDIRKKAMMATHEPGDPINNESGDGSE